MKVILGKKIGITQLIHDNGKVDPVTVISAGPCFVTQIKNGRIKTFQIGFETAKKLNKPRTGHLKDKKLKHLREFKIDQDNESIYQENATIDLSIFDPKNKLDITGTSKGKGFAGAVKRHHFSIGPKSHGSKHHRRVGSTGGRFPQRTTKGRRMPGRLGNDRTTIKNLSIIRIEADKNLLLIKGSVPGTKNQLLIIRQK